MDPCNAFFSFLCLHFDSAANSYAPIGIAGLFNHSVIL